MARTTDDLKREYETIMSRVSFRGLGARDARELSKLVSELSRRGVRLE